MSIWKPVDYSQITNETILVNKTFNIDDTSYGQKFIQFKSGSSSEFNSDDSGSHWDASRLNFYLSGSDLNFQSNTSSYEGGVGIGYPAHSFLGFDSVHSSESRDFPLTGGINFLQHN